jgi:hypothetical protein
MADSSSLWSQVGEQADKLLRLLEDRSFEGQPRDAAIVFMYSRARRLYMAALLLLRAELPEESAIIGRSLFETAMRLRQLAADPTDRDALIVGWLRGSITESEGLLRDARSLGVDPDIEEELERSKERRNLLDAYASPDYA